MVSPLVSGFGEYSGRSCLAGTRHEGNPSASYDRPHSGDRSVGAETSLERRSAMKLGKSTGLGKGNSCVTARPRPSAQTLTVASRPQRIRRIARHERTRIGQAVATLAGAHPGQAGIYFLRNGPDAFATRLLLAAHAERSLDVQYYIWRGDLNGHAAARRAARGRRSRRARAPAARRQQHAGLDATLAALDSHPNIEVRLFNPFVLRRPRALAISPTSLA